VAIIGRLIEDYTKMVHWFCEPDHPMSWAHVEIVNTW